jgi:cobaltochelatase CobS
MTTLTQNFGYADDLFGFPKFPTEVREASRFPIKTGQSDFVPELDKAYVFRKEHLRTIQFWAAGVEKNILLQVETGTGKTTLIEQVASRLNWPTFTVGCHGGLEFQELIGRVTLQTDGSTGWADGPLIAAMRFGGIFLLDEMNFLKPEVAGGLNTVLQATAYTIPETGEIVRAHPDFRIAATGNAMDGVGKGAYRGTQTTNIALLARFTLGIRVRYMSPMDEQAMITAKAPGLDEKVANYLAEVANMARKSHEEGVLKAPMSPRETIASGRRLTAYSGNLEGENALQAQCKAVASAFEMTFLFRWAPDERSEFVKASNSVASRLGLPIVLE